MTGMLLDEMPLEGRRRISRRSERFRWAIARFGFFQKPVTFQLQHQLFEHRAHRPGNTECVGRGIHTEFRAQLADHDASYFLHVVETDSSVQEFARAFEPAGANAGGSSRRAQEKNPAEAN